MIHFDFVVSDVDAENILDCINCEISRCYSNSISGEITGAEIDALSAHIKYLKELKLKMLNSRVGEQDDKVLASMQVALEHPDSLTINILRLWPRDQIERFALHLIGEVRHQKMMEDAEECPDCKQKSVVCASGGGVKCLTPGCGYWFCY